MTNEEGQEYYKETMPIPRQTTHRELLEEAMKALEPFSVRNEFLDEREFWKDEELIHFSDLSMKDVRQARTTYDKLKAAL